MSPYLRVGVGVVQHVGSLVNAVQVPRHTPCLKGEPRKGLGSAHDPAPLSKLGPHQHPPTSHRRMFVHARLRTNSASGSWLGYIEPSNRFLNATQTENPNRFKSGKIATTLYADTLVTTTLHLVRP